jgi:hypothetical protein
MDENLSRLIPDPYFQIRYHELGLRLASLTYTTRVMKIPLPRLPTPDSLFSS